MVYSRRSFWFYVFGIYFFTGSTEHANVTCGIDYSPITVVYEGFAKIDTYPWIGTLFYPFGKKRLTTVVILVTRQIVIGTATEIDKLPKKHFRARSKVVLGHNCSGPAIPVRDYTYHPDYTRATYSAIALIQLDTDHIKQELHPICPPPSHFIDPHFYAITLSDDCKNPMVKIYKMIFVGSDECKTFYRRTGLDVESMWPTHTACARALTGGECVWRSGTVLVLRQNRRWKLVGFGVYGPGCEAPARFLDYGLYHEWVKKNIARMGRPAVTRMAPDHIILRRTLSNVQRFGPCDLEEVKDELYTDRTEIIPEPMHIRRAVYNVSIYANVEYSCVIFRVYHDNQFGDEVPQLRLRRWCSGPRGICFDFGFIDIAFYVEIYFTNKILFKVSAYGRQAKIIDSTKGMSYSNYVREYPDVGEFEDIKNMLISQKHNHTHYWFYKDDTGAKQPPDNNPADS